MSTPSAGEISARARILLDQHGLSDWKIKLDHARRRAGCCYHQTKTIGLSITLLQHYSPADIDGVILHEVAHALAGASHKHDAYWKKIAIKVGATPRARLSADLPSPQAPWVGICPHCGTTRKLYRRPRRVVSCGICSRTFSRDLILKWEFQGVPQIPGGVYQKELRRISR